MLRLSGISKRFGATEAVKDFHLEIETGRTTVLIGPSGCGKSTILRLIIGLLNPDEGNILFDSELMNDGTAGQFRHRIGYVIQDGGLFPHLTAAGNISLMARYLGWSEAAVSERIAELCALTQFPAELLPRYPLQLSGGQKQRVSLMRALMLDPALLLMDEPLAALDPLIRYDLQGELKTIFSRLKKTVIFVTHDLNEAAFLGDLIVLMREGRIVQKGSISDLMHRPADPFVDRFITAQRFPLESSPE
ncbi:MAG: ATP-binding cassette domain-containing protein [Calditrichia bacterium]